MCTQTTIRLSFFEAVHGCSRKVNFDYFIRDPNAANKQVRCCTVVYAAVTLTSTFLVSFSPCGILLMRSCCIGELTHYLLSVYVPTGTQRVQSQGETVQERGRGHPSGRGHGHHDAHARPGGGGRSGLPRRCVMITLFSSFAAPLCRHHASGCLAVPCGSCSVLC
jgi:hypothetical protein